MRFIFSGAKQKIQKYGVEDPALKIIFVFRKIFSFLKFQNTLDIFLKRQTFTAA